MHAILPCRTGEHKEAECICGRGTTTWNVGPGLTVTCDPHSFLMTNGATAFACGTTSTKW